jgi:predicted N-acetyltransferase YhbS
LYTEQRKIHVTPMATASHSNFIPDFPLEIIEEEQMPAALDAAVRKLLCLCFSAEVNVFSETRHWHGSAPAYSVVHLQGDTVVGHVGVVVRTIRCGERDTTVAGMQNVAVHPTLRGCGLGPKLMAATMAEAKRRGILFGLLFCLPELERYYRSVGWFNVVQPATMRDERGTRVPTPEKNICMAYQLSLAPFPNASIDLQGRDW